MNKDIWGLIFEQFEDKFDPYTLNALSLTCRKLNQIDRERRIRYQNELYHYFEFCGKGLNYGKGES